MPRHAVQTHLPTSPPKRASRLSNSHIMSEASTLADVARQRTRDIHVLLLPLSPRRATARLLMRAVMMKVLRGDPSLLRRGSSMDQHSREWQVVGSEEGGRGNLSRCRRQSLALKRSSIWRGTWSFVRLDERHDHPNDNC